jgi:hypothetical protein
VSWKGLLVCAAVFLAACAQPGTWQVPTAAQVLASRLAAFAAARSVTMAGHVSLADVSYRVSLQVDDRDQAVGTVDLGQFPVAAILAGGQVYLKSADYYTARSLATGGQWVLEGDGRVVSLLKTLANRKELSAALLAIAGSAIQQGPGRDVTGASTVKLSSADVSATVPVASGKPPVRVVTGLDTKLSDGLSDVLLDLSDYGQPTSIAVPDGFLDRAQPDTLLAHYQAMSSLDMPFSFEGCDRSGYTLSASFKNIGGKVGTASATFYVARAGTTLGSCDVQIPGTGYGGIVRTGCRVTFDNSAEVYGNVLVHNPQ